MTMTKNTSTADRRNNACSGMTEHIGTAASSSPEGGSLRIASLNCRSLKNSHRDVMSLCDAHDVVFLQETWLLPHDLGSLASFHPDFLGFGTSAVETSAGVLSGRPYGGMAFLWRRDLAEHINIHSYEDPRILGASVRWLEQSVLLLNVYLPTADQANVDFLDCLGKIQAIVEEASPCQLVLAGDFNAAPGRRQHEWILELCDDIDLTVVDENVLPPDSFTYVSDSHGSTSWLDHVLMSPGISSVCTCVRILYENIISDHRPISFSLNLGDLPRAEILRPTATMKVNWSLLTRDDLAAYSEAVYNRLSGVIIPIAALRCEGCSHQLHHDDMRTYFKRICETMTQAAKAYERTIRSTDHQVPGWSDVVQDAHRVARSDFLYWKSMGSPRQGSAFLDMRVSKARFKYALRSCRKHRERKQADGLAKALLNRDSTSFWNQVRRLGRSSSAVASAIDGHSGADNICQFWKSHYSDLLNSVSNPAHDVLLEAELDAASNLDLVWTPTDFAKYRAGLKLGKSAGLDGLCSEHLRFAPGIMDIHMSLIWNAMYKHSFLPEELLSVKIVPIVKNPAGDLASSKNYRPVAIATPVSKLLEVAILDKLDWIADIPEPNQFGFRRKSATDQCVFALKERIRRYVQLEGPVYCCFLDASKAFDRVVHSTLFRQLLRHNIPASIVKLLRFWYSKQQMFVSWNGCLSAGFLIGNGVRQGGITSPVLYNIYSNLFSQELNRCMVGCTLNEVSVNHLAYADDVCLISPSVGGLRQLLRICEEVAEYLSIRFNPDKSVCMRFLPKVNYVIPLFEVLLKGVPLNFVQETKYLGHIICDDLSDHADMQKTIRTIYARGNMLTRKFGKCSHQVKKVLFRSYMTPLYCGHLWGSYTQGKKRDVIQAYNRIFRKFFQIKNYDPQKQVHISTSRKLVELDIPCIDVIIRNLTRSIFERFQKSVNPICADCVHFVSFSTFIGQCYLKRFM